MKPSMPTASSGEISMLDLVSADAWSGDESARAAWQSGTVQSRRRQSDTWLDRLAELSAWLIAALVLLVGLASGNVWAQQAGKNFDHTRTGFALSGQHKQQRCESCHINGVFKGTPRDCASCHTAGAKFSRGNAVMPQNHVPTSRGCDTCHGTQGFGGARFSHGGVKAGSCASCHNGVQANGKTANHIVTSAACDSCHRPGSAWATLAKFDHSGVAAGTCAGCHNGSKATGPSSAHVPVGQVSGMSSACDQCHRSGFTTWLPAKVHANYAITRQCATCHTGSFPPAVGKPATPVHANAGACEGCHSSTSVWSLGSRPDHSAFNASTTCSNCHNGSTASAKSANHIPTSQNCISCHNATGSWKPSTWNHTQLPVSSQCATCHTGGYAPADGPVANHIAYKNISASAAANCDSCHKGGYASWNPGLFHRNFSVNSGCASCHNAGALGATQKPSTAIHSGVTTCETCHTNTAAWTSGGRPDHSAYTGATNCATCHDGKTAPGKSASHIPTSLNCSTCHTATASSWKPTLWNHTQQAVSGQCASCHSGSFAPADGPVSNHIAYKSIPATAAANCDSCHKAGYASWNPGTFHRNVSVTASCASCHNAGALGATQKPNTAVHAGVTVCETCHLSTGSWASSGKPDHSTFTTSTNCSNCHNGSTASTKSAAHIPTTLNCVACHTATASWKPSKWNHTQQSVSGQCATCHSGSYAPADGPVSNHIAYKSLPASASANCDACHKAGYASWNPGNFHRNISVNAGCASCHNAGALGATQKPNTAVHAGVTVCETCHTTTSSWASSGKPDHSTFTTATTCTTCHNGSTAGGKSGTHIPTTANCVTCHNATGGWKPSKWNHSQVVVAGQCATCHSGAYSPADGPVSNHIAYKSVPAAAAANCDSCHKAGYASWNPGGFHRYFSVSGGCATCHNAGGLGATQKPNTAVHAGVTVCESCHTTTASWASSGKPDHATFTAATTCTNCHNGSTASGKPGTHIPTTANCVTCHNTTGTWKPAKWNHSQVVVTGQCATCHTGGYAPADGPVGNHIPYKSVSTSAAMNCDGCHKGGYASWNPGYFHRYVTVSTNCSTCHLSPAYLGPTQTKPGNSTHATVTGNCESCHKSTSTWSGATFAHTAANAVGTGTCDTCHNGSTAKGKSATHVPLTVATAKCDSCHKSQTSFATAVTMNHSVVTGQSCKTCHNGSYTSQGTQGALGKTTNHIPETQLLNGSTMDCSACHTSTTAFSTVRMNHNSSMGNGAGWCKGCHLSGTSFAGGMERKSLTHESRSASVTDCSMSGCHRPLGNKGAAYSKWD